MSASTARLASALARPRRRWRGLAILVMVAVVAAFGASALFGGLTRAIMHRLLGHIDGGGNPELRVIAPSAWQDPPLAIVAREEPKAALPPAPRPSMPPPPASHGIDAFAGLKLPKVEGHMGDPVRQSPPTRSEIAAAAFGGKAKAIDLPGARATVASDLDLTLRPGTRIACILQNAIDTSTGSGVFSCAVTGGGARSWSGHVELVRDGDIIDGTYQGLKTGRERILAIGGYITGSDGLVVPLNSAPATDAEGRMGMDGEILSNWWPRLRSALVLDLAQSAMSALPALAATASGGGTFLNLNTSQSSEAAAEALRHDSDIPDVLKKNQGEVISLVVQQPIYFQDAIRLRLRNHP